MYGRIQSCTINWEYDIDDGEMRLKRERPLSVPTTRCDIKPSILFQRILSLIDRTAAMPDVGICLTATDWHIHQQMQLIWLVRAEKFCVCFFLLGFPI